MEDLDISCLAGLDLEWASAGSLPPAPDPERLREAEAQKILAENAALIRTPDGTPDISILVEKCAREEEAERVAHPPLSEALQMYAEFCQDAWVRGVIREWMLSDQEAVFLLTGDAGTGKTRTIKNLESVLADLNPGALCMTAPTHKAVSVLGFGAKTTPSAMGWSFEMCVAGPSQFKELYSSKKAHVIQAWKEICKNTASLASSIKGHPCKVLDMRCKHCALGIKACIGRNAPPFVGSSIILVDEYGILDSDTFAKIKWCLDLFTLPGQGYKIIFSGSVSQLPPPGASGPVWKDDRFLASHNWSYPLLINFRQVSDPVFGNMLKHMQYNLITPQGAALLNKRVVGDSLAYSPLFKPHVVRIFNSNVKRDEYNNRYAEYSNEIITFDPIIGPDKDYRGRVKSTAREFVSYMKNMYAKLFSAAAGTRLKFHRGSFVELMGPARPRGRHVLMKLEGGTAHVKNVLSDEVVRIPPLVCAHQGHRTSFPAIYPIQGINTYSCQGDTIEGGVVYCPPPKQYMRSDIKPSAYVTMSRVVSREHLFLACNPFSAPGEYRFFTDDVLTYKKQYEQCYVKK